MYDFYLGKHKRPVVWSEADRQDAWPEIIDWRDDVSAENAQHDDVPSAAMQESFDTAKRFVELTLGYDLSRVNVAITRNELYVGMTAYHDPNDSMIRSKIDFDSPHYARVSNDLARQAITGLFVHELAHATGENTARLIGVRDEKKSVAMHMGSGLQAVDMRAPIIEVGIKDVNHAGDARVGHFFEEAFAEEVAARWRESTNPHIAQDGDKECGLLFANMPRLPFRYVDSEGKYDRYPDDFFVSHSAICSEGIRLLTAHTGVDIFQYMLDSRDPDKEAGAKRAIAQATESVRPGLYTQLRDTIYTPYAFRRSYELIRASVDLPAPRIASSLGVAAAHLDYSTSME